MADSRNQRPVPMSNAGVNTGRQRGLDIGKDFIYQMLLLWLGKTMVG